MGLRPIFLFSLPRAGSTLVQRVLAFHQEVTTTSEPWLLLPLLAARRADVLAATYNQRLAIKAVEDFVRTLPRGEDDYRAELRSFVLGLYRKAARPGARYFLDKSPRYHLVADEIVRLFPDAKYLFLWRNPLAVIASILETWAEGRWSLHRWYVDLFDGLANLLATYGRWSEVAHAVRYEDLVLQPDASWPSLFRYLGIRFDPTALREFPRVELEGRMGDPTGSARYRSLSLEPLDKWRQTLRNPFRKRWCRRYLRWIGSERLALMGYDLDELLEALEGVPGSLRSVGSDLVRASAGTALWAWKRRALWGGQARPGGRGGWGGGGD